MPVAITYPTLTDEATLWQTRADAAAFFDAFEVPDATTSVPGVVTKAAALSYTNFISYDTQDFTTLDIDGTNVTLVNQATFEEVRTKLLTVTAAFNNLLTRLRNAGLLES